MSRKSILILAASLGVLLAGIVHYFKPNDRKMIQNNIMNIVQLVQTTPLPDKLIAQTKLAKKLLQFTVEDLLIFDDLRSESEPLISEQDQLISYLYAAQRIVENAEIQVKDLSIEVHELGQATSEFVIDYTAHLRINSVADGVVPVSIKWTKLDGEWKIRSIRRLDIFE
ncbi:MAG: hypothetical protein R2827_07600 [Bdellovibrionales bacterium]